MPILSFKSNWNNIINFFFFFFLYIEQLEKKNNNELPHELTGDEKDKGFIKLKK